MVDFTVKLLKCKNSELGFLCDGQAGKNAHPGTKDRLLFLAEQNVSG